MSCPSSRTRTPDNGRFLVLSLGDESVVLTETWFITDYVEISHEVTHAVAMLLTLTTTHSG